MVARSDSEIRGVDALIKSLVRGSLILAILAVVIPAGFYALFERQARRLDALADHGQQTQATVTGRRRGSTFYAYVVGGETHTWSVRDGQAPSTVGETFTITYLPEAPSFSRAGADRSVAAIEAAANRNFSSVDEVAVGAPSRAR